MQHRPTGVLLLLVLAIGTCCQLATASTVLFEQQQEQEQLAHSRALLQQDALSNSNGCLATIPKCEAGACASRNVKGVARWVCLRCMANYDPVTDDSGQDNIIQCGECRDLNVTAAVLQQRPSCTRRGLTPEPCLLYPAVCPKGFFEPAANASACQRCPVNTFCPGGDRVENPRDRGVSTTCGPNMVTRNSGARSQADCLSPAGYAQTSPMVATPCLRSEYSPAFNRLARCLRCQNGLEEPRNSTLTDGQRSSKRAVCSEYGLANGRATTGCGVSSDLLCCTVCLNPLISLLPSPTNCLDAAQCCPRANLCPRDWSGAAPKASTGRTGCSLMHPTGRCACHAARALRQLLPTQDQHRFATWWFLGMVLLLSTTSLGPRQSHPCPPTSAMEAFLQPQFATLAIIPCLATAPSALDKQ